MRIKRALPVGYLLTLLALAACASQAEGERCDVATDCESGLRCTPLSTEGAVCCPEDRAPNEDVCRSANIGTGGRTGTGGSSSGGSSSGGTGSGGTGSGGEGTGGTTTDGSPGLPPDAGIDGAAQSG